MLRFICLIVFAISSAMVKAAIPDEVDRFIKCYTQFVGEVPPYSDEILSEVRSGSKTGVEGCAAILQHANLFYDGLLGTDESGEYDELGRKVLARFNSIHNDFFESANRISIGDSRYIYDYNDRSYYLLLSLFSVDDDNQSNYSFRNIFTDPTTYRATRDKAGGNSYLLHRTETHHSPSINAPTLNFSRGSHHLNDWAETPQLNTVYNMLTNRALQNAAIDVSSGYMTVTAHTSFLREEDRILNTSLAEAGTNGVDFFGDYDNTSFPIGPEDLVETGDIIGIVAQNERMLPNLYNKLFNEGDGYDRHYNGPGFKQPYPFKIDNIYDNLGGGLLFTPNAQEAMSVDENYIFSQNGVDQVPRVWSDNFIEDFLCRDIPVIRSADAAEHVVPDGGEYGAFKESISCQECHASMDPLAFIARNYRFSRTGAIFSEYFYVNHFSHPTYPALTEELIEPDVYFPVRPGDGHFRFRDMYGNYHNEALTSSVSEPKKAFKDLANYFSDLDDTYACFASKYLYHFTGLEVELFDPGHVDAPVLNSREVALKEYVIGLGKKLKNSEDAREVILDIVKSDIFINPKSGNIPQGDL